MRYARAMFDYALEKHVEDQVFSEMKTLATNLDKEKRFRVALDNPVLNTNDKLKLIKSTFEKEVSDAFVKFIELVLHQKREYLLQRMSLVYMDLYRRYKNISVGRLITASPVDKSQIDKIKQLVLLKETGSVEFTAEIDPSIDGGFILFFDTYRLDASISTQLKKIKEQLLSKNKRIA